MKILNQLDAVVAAINERVYEREEETNGILVSLLSGLSCFFLGGVGTAKTMQIRLVAALCGLSEFDILLSETTKPDAIFGPPDIPALAEGRQVTKTKGYASEAQILFFDEMFKANSMVLNPLLRLINEKEYRNGDLGVQKCPILSVYAASNEVPNDEGLEAVYDRLVLRYEVRPLIDEEAVIKMAYKTLSGGDAKPKAILTAQEFAQIRALLTKVEVPLDIGKLILKIRNQVQLSCHTTISDRRVAQAFKVVQAQALLNHHKLARVADVEILANVFWSQPDQIGKVKTIVLANISSNLADIFTYSEAISSIWSKAMETGEVVEAKDKLKLIAKKLKGLKSATAKKIANRAHALLGTIANMENDRTSFAIVKVEINQAIMYRVSAATSSLWSKSQLRDAGFHLRRGKNYWYQWAEGAGDAAEDKELIEEVKGVLGVTPTVCKQVI